MGPFFVWIVVMIETKVDMVFYSFIFELLGPFLLKPCIIWIVRCVYFVSHSESYSITDSKALIFQKPIL